MRSDAFHQMAQPLETTDVKLETDEQKQEKEDAEALKVVASGIYKRLLVEQDMTQVKKFALMLHDIAIGKLSVHRQVIEGHTVLRGKLVWTVKLPGSFMPLLDTIHDILSEHHATVRETLESNTN